MKTEVAQGASFQNNSGLNNPQQTITFNEIILPPRTGLINQYAGLGLIFPPLIVEDREIPKLYYVNLNPGVNGASNLAASEYFSLKFTQEQTAAAFSMGTDPTETTPNVATFTALYQGTQVESFDAMTDFPQTDNFFGFKDILFDEIQVNFAIDYDNPIVPNAIISKVQIGTSFKPPLEVPEPTSVISLLIIGLFGIQTIRNI
jgi:hypothetical protein